MQTQPITFFVVLFPTGRTRRHRGLWHRWRGRTKGKPRRFSGDKRERGGGRQASNYLPNWIIKYIIIREMFALQVSALLLNPVWYPPQLYRRNRFWGRHAKRLFAKPDFSLIFFFLTGWRWTSWAKGSTWTKGRGGKQIERRLCANSGIVLKKNTAKRLHFCTWENLTLSKAFKEERLS